MIMAGGSGREVNTVGLRNRTGPGATSGAEPVTVRALLEEIGEEDGSAVFACLLKRPPASPRGAYARDKNRGVRHKVCASSGHVAAMTRWNQVGQLVVAPVPVDVINDEIVPHGRSPHCPVNLFAAPVARVGARTDRVVQRDSVGTDPTRFGGQRMARRVCRVIDVRLQRARILLGACRHRLLAPSCLARVGAEHAFGFYLGGVAFQGGTAGEARVGQLSTDVRLVFSHMRESTLYAPAKLVGLTKIGEGKCQAEV